MNRRSIAGLVGIVAFIVLFTQAVTPLLSVFLGLGLGDTTATLLTWFVVVLVPIGLAWLVNKL